MPITSNGAPVIRARGLFARHGYHGLYQGHRILIDADLAADQLARVLRHERTHERQHSASGLTFAAWLAEYNRILGRVGYLNHPWEIEARRAETPKSIGA